VHQIGMPCDLTRLVEIGRRYGLPVIEDAACAIGAEILWHGRWEAIGAPQGDIACFSFHPRKVISTGDGGMITARSPAWLDACRQLRQHAMSVPAATRHASAQVVFARYDRVGFNYRMTDIQAAVGREQLKRLPGLIADRRRLAACYRGLLADIEGLGLPQQPRWARSNWQSYCVQLPAHCDQRAVMQAMLDDGIGTRRGVMSSHREAACADLPLRQPLPQSEAASDHCILLPLFPQMTGDEQARVAASLRHACTPVRSAGRARVGAMA